MTTTFLWHDYETTGLNTHRDRPAQFAAIRTDMDLNIIGDPIMIYCKPSEDVLPGPIAAMVTGITPQVCEEKGLTEHDFAKTVESLLAKTGTIGVGYNTINYDDEITRFMLWRNLFDPYAREWANNCGRWDIIDMARAAYSLRSEGIHWPTNEHGKPSFKLEELSKANGLVHEAAHDALSDVYATIAFAKLIKEKNPKLFEYAFSMHKKDKPAEVINTQTRAPFVHISRNYGSERGFIAPVMPIQVHPTNKNEFICWDLTADPSELMTMDAETMLARMYTKREDRGEDFVRLGIQKIALNKSPMIMKSLGLLKDGTAERWGIDLNLVHDNMIKLQEILKERDLSPIFNEVYKKDYSMNVVPDEDLYGGFIDRNDRRTLDGLNRASATVIASAKPRFTDDRLGDIFFNFKARNYPSTLTSSEQQRWNDVLRSRLIEGANEFTTFAQFHSEVEALKIENAEDPKRITVLNELKDYAQKLENKITANIDQKLKSNPGMR